MKLMKIFCWLFGHNYSLSFFSYSAELDDWLTLTFCSRCGRDDYAATVAEFQRKKEAASRDKSTN